MANLINRRSFLKTTTALTLGTYASRSFGFNSSANRPNLLFIWTDQQRCDTLAVYGNTQIRMPNLNRLATESVVFRNSYVTQPVCTPSRGSIMTGLWPHQSGLLANNMHLSRETKCFPEMVHDSAYRTGYLGKWHLGDELWKQHGFDEWISIEDNYINYYSPGRDRSQRSTYDAYLIRKGYKHNNKKKDIFSRPYVSTLAFEDSKPKYLEIQAVDFLERHRNDNFILYVNFLEPHTPVNGPFNDMHNPDELDRNPNVDCNLGDDDPLLYRNKAENYKKQMKDWKNINAKYFGLCSEIDIAIGGILGKLDSLGLRDNTIVVFTSDHGDMMGSHGFFNKSVMYSEAVKVPWLVRWPELSPKQRVITQNVSHIDLVPTLLELLGKQKPNEIPGKSLVPLIRGQVKDNGDVFVEWNAGPGGDDDEEGFKKTGTEDDNVSKSANIRTIVTQDGWKLCLSDYDKSQLFNLNDDPGECKNLYYGKNHRDAIEKLRKRILDWQNSVNDTVSV